MNTDLQKLLDNLNTHIKSEMIVNPEVVDKGDDLDIDTLPIVARKWFKMTEVVAVVADLKGSTNLGVGKHAASTAAIYEAATGGLVKILESFDADFIAIQGDGAFGLFWGDLRMERAICAGITIKTFSEKHLVPALKKKWPELPDTGFKIGIAASKILVKKVGIPRSEVQEPLWAGKAVNYASKCAQQADVGEMIVTGSIWDYFEDNDYIVASCSCGSGPSDSIWSDVLIDKIHEGDGELAGRKLVSLWCDIHGSQYCASVLSGEKKRSEAEAIVTELKKAQRRNLVREKERLLRENRRNMLHGLYMARR